MTARRPLIAGNWKMNGLKADGLALVRTLAERAKGGGVRCDLVVCPPATLVAAVVEAAAGTPLCVGGQDCHMAERGAYTGDISALMLKDAGCSHVIVGHSERRTGHGEGDAMVRAKAAAALKAGLSAIICVGETEEERDAGRAVAVVQAQITASLPEAASAADTLIAYEPVWAIGTGRTPTPEDVAEVHAAARASLGDVLGAAQSQAVRILYGGSMKPSNARMLLALEDVDGGLIGGASLNAEDFWAIAESCP